MKIFFTHSSSSYTKLFTLLRDVYPEQRLKSGKITMQANIKAVDQVGTPVVLELGSNDMAVGYSILVLGR